MIPIKGNNHFKFCLVVFRICDFTQILYSFACTYIMFNNGLQSTFFDVHGVFVLCICATPTKLCMITG